MAAGPDERARNRRAVLEVLGQLLDDYQSRGFWGTTDFHLDWKDGLVSLVRKDGEQETIKIAG